MELLTCNKEASRASPDKASTQKFDGYGFRSVQNVPYFRGYERLLTSFLCDGQDHCERIRLYLVKVLLASIFLCK